MRRWSIASIFGGVLLLVFAAVLYGYRAQLTQTEDAAAKLLTPVSHFDFGIVSTRGGKVSAKLPLLNRGQKDLAIVFLNTSCGCASARVINNGKAGPLFGVASRGITHTHWRTVLQPGGKAQLQVFYDPRFHPDYRGKGSREIAIYTQDGSMRLIEVTFDQVD